MVVFLKDGLWKKPSKLIKREKLLVLVIDKKNIFSTNNEKRKI